MKTTPLTLDLQAYVDGALEPARRAEIERVLKDDAEARALVDGLRQISQLVRDHEPKLSVPASREFFWSQIQKRIDAADAATARDQRPARPARSALAWLRWLVPALGVAAVAVVISLQRPPTPSFAGAENDDTLTFHSDADGVTIHWVN